METIPPSTNSPIPTDIPAFVAIGPTPDLSITVTKQTFDMGFILATFGLCSLIIVVLVLTIFYANKQSTITVPPARTPIKSKRQFFAVESTGQISADFFDSQPIENLDGCTRWCTSYPICTGVLYSEGQCTLLKNNIIIPEDNEILPTSSNLYVSQLHTNNLIIEGHILLAKYQSSVPNRYWVNTESSYYFPHNTVVKLPFFPRYYKSHNLYTGIFCLFSFTVDQIPDIIQTDFCYIHTPETPLKLPDDWQDKTPIYVAYIN